MCGVTTIVANNRIEIRPPARSTPAPAWDGTSQAAGQGPDVSPRWPRRVWMRLAFLGAGLALVAAGCSPLQLAHRTLHGELNEFPRLTRQKFSYLVKQMKDYRDGRRTNDNGVMAASMKDLSDAQIQSLAHYLTSL